MELELGPFPADAVKGWSRLHRRLAVELRSARETETTEVGEDLLASWSSFVETLDSHCRACDGEFRWTHPLDEDEAEFLLHGLDRCLRSPVTRKAVTAEELSTHAGFTLHVVESLTTALVAEGRGCEHFLDEARSLLQP